MDTVGTVKNTYTLLEPLPCNASLISGTSINCTPGSQVTQMAIGGYVQYMFNLFVAIAAVAAVFMIVFGGFQYMTTDAIEDKSEGKTKIRHAIEGLLLVLGSYLLLQTINPQFVAIPTNLVEPLGIAVKGSPFDGFFSSITNNLDYLDARGFAENKAEITATRAAVQNAKIQATELSAEIDQLYNDLDLAEDPVEQAAIVEEIAQKTSELKAIPSDIAARTAIATANNMAEIAKAGASGGSYGMSTSTEAVYRAALPNLTPEAAASVQKQLIYDQAVIDINKQVQAAQAKINAEGALSYTWGSLVGSNQGAITNTTQSARDAARNNIDQIVKQYTKNPSASPELIAKVREEAATAVTKANNLIRQ